MINYTPASQLTFENFTTPFDQHLREDNRWVKLAAIIPWDHMARIYSSKLDPNSGRECVEIRTVLAAIIIKHRLKMSDRETVDSISENLYLQYFAGYPSFCSRPPFDASLFVDIRKRLGVEEFDKMTCVLLEEVEKAEQQGKKKNRPSKKNTDCDCEGQNQNPDRPSQEDSDNPSPKADLPNKGKLKLDATVCDQAITYPTDLKLVSGSREESERLIDELFARLPLKTKPRTYRRIARKLYIGIAQNRNKSKTKIRKSLGQQLRFLKRNLGHIEKLLDRFTGQRFPLNNRDQHIYWVIQHIYDQQAKMHKEKTRSCPDRIVNIYQPYVRPIVRGKDKNKVEFGAKIGVSEHDGFCRINHFSWDAYNECKDLVGQVEAYRNQYGYWPEVVLADRIYLNRENRKWLKQNGIRISGKPLGRPPKEQLTAYQKRKQQKERNQRNHIEAKFGQGKNGYGLNYIRARRSDTSKSWISAIFFVMNLINYGKAMSGKFIFWLKRLVIVTMHHVWRGQHRNIMQLTGGNKLSFKISLCVVGWGLEKIGKP